MFAQPLWGKPIFAPDHFLTQADLLKRPEDDSRVELYQGGLLQLELHHEYEGNISGRICSYLFRYLEQLGRENCVTLGAGFDLTISGERDTILAPDVAVAQLPVKPRGGYRKLPPLVAVEVVSPSQSRPEMAMKARFYLAAGVKLVWVVWPDARTIEVWTAPEQVMTLQETETITGGDTLPGFSCAVTDFFPPADEEE